MLSREELLGQLEQLNLTDRAWVANRLRDNIEEAALFLRGKGYLAVDDWVRLFRAGVKYRTALKALRKALKSSLEAKKP